MGDDHGDGDFLVGKEPVPGDFARRGGDARLHGLRRLRSGLRFGRDDVGEDRLVELVDLHLQRRSEVAGDRVEQEVQGVPRQRSLGVVGLAVDGDVEQPVLVDPDHHQGQDDRNPEFGCLVSPVRSGRVQETHSPTTAAGSVRAGASTFAASRFIASAGRSSPGGSPSPTCGVSSWSRTLTAVLRTRSAVACTTSTGVLPGTLLAHEVTYGIVYVAVSRSCAAPIINATDSASTSAIPRCMAASSLSGPWSMTCPSSFLHQLDGFIAIVLRLGML